MVSFTALCIKKCLRKYKQKHRRFEVKTNELVILSSISMFKLTNHYRLFAFFNDID